MKKCKYCKSDIDNRATVCPVCKRKQSSTLKTILFVLFMIFIGIPMFFGCMAGLLGYNPSKNSSTTSVSAPTDSVQEKKDSQSDEESASTENESVNENVYRLKSGELGEYGRIVTLNANTDMPVDKYLYKLPAGEYTATTTFDKMASFFIVKDETATEDNPDYPEILQYVGDSYMLTAGEVDFNGTAQKQVGFTLNEDESIQIPDAVKDCVFIFENQNANTTVAEQTTEIIEETTEAVEIVATPNVSKEYKNALRKAESYSKNMHMSKKGIYDQLTSQYGEGFSADAAQYAIDNLTADYNANALAKAKSYSDSMSMSKAGIYDQLISEYGEQFTPEEAQYAVDNLVTDYNANALKKAKSYQDRLAMSKDAIYDQLVSEYGEKFTASEAQYAIDNLG